MRPRSVAKFIPRSIPGRGLLQGSLAMCIVSVLAACQVSYSDESSSSATAGTTVAAQAPSTILSGAVVAEAGPSQTLSCITSGSTTKANLDGSGSTGPTGVTLTYDWYENNQLIATGIKPMVTLAAGTHTIELVVDDGQAFDTDTVQIQVPVCTSCQAPGTSVWNRCTPTCPCPHGGGDCDTDSDCQAGLRCADNVGPEYGYEFASIDVCVADCPDSSVGQSDHCTIQCPCSHGEADCDSDAECEPGLRCLRDVGAGYGYDDPDTDVCVAGCPPSISGVLGTHDFCSASCPCVHGEGDCDSNSECAFGHVCVRDVGARYGYDPETDVCEFLQISI